MKDEIAKIISDETNLGIEEVKNHIEMSSKDDFGDYSFPCFILAKKLKKNPMEVAKGLSDVFNEKSFKGIYSTKSKGAYINFFVDRRYFSKIVLEEFEKNKFTKKKRKEKRVIEFSSPNTHKAFHVGHIRGTAIGESLSRIFEFNGDKVFRVNYSGDTGMHVAKWIWCYKKYHSKESVKQGKPVVTNLYADTVSGLQSLFKLNSLEKKIWTLLLSRGSLTPKEMLPIRGLSESKLLKILDSLVKKGFVVSKINKEKKVKYTALKPEEVVDEAKKTVLKSEKERAKKLDEFKVDEAWIASVYVDAVKKLDKNEELQEEVNLINLKLETKEDKELNALWEKTRLASIKSWDKIYYELNTHFDRHYFESEFEFDGKIIVDGLLKKGIAKRDDAVFMDLEKYGLGVWVLTRKDGTVLYSAKDIALAYKKARDFEANNYLVLVGDEQRLHFQQLKKTLELMSFPDKEHYNFLPFGLVRFPEGKMSSRTGENILYSDFIKKVSDFARKGLIDRGTPEKEIDQRAVKLAIAAIKYSMLKQDLNKVLIFDPKEAISFEGDTGPYLMYSYARANSIVKKVKGYNKLKLNKLEIPYVNEFENRLLKKISLFPVVVEKAYDSLSPALIANYSFELCKLFNEFYHNCPVIGSEEEKFRLKLVGAFRKVVKDCLDLLGIDALEEM